jgi:hypothetical protein
MQDKKELWMQFCEQAAVEQDPDKLIQLVSEINRMLEEKENRLLRQRDQASGVDIATEPKTSRQTSPP